MLSSCRTISHSDVFYCHPTLLRSLGVHLIVLGLMRSYLGISVSGLEDDHFLTARRKMKMAMSKVRSIQVHQVYNDILVGFIKCCHVLLWLEFQSSVIPQTDMYTNIYMYVFTCVFLMLLLHMPRIIFHFLGILLRLQSHVTALHTIYIPYICIYVCTLQEGLPAPVEWCCKFLCSFARVSAENQRVLFDHISYLLEYSERNSGMYHKYICVHVHLHIRMYT